MERRNLLSEALPDRFDFYHLGEIRLAPREPAAGIADLPGLEDSVALGFTIQGDLRAALVIVLEAGLDVSIYSEAGNIVASRLVTRLAREKGLDLVLSPPQLLERRQLERLAAGAASVEQRVYFHGDVPVPAWLFTENPG